MVQYMCNNLHISYYTTYILVATYSYQMYRSWIINLILILIHHHQHHHIAAVSSFLNNYLLPTQPLSPPLIIFVKNVYCFSILVLQLKSYHHGFKYKRIRAPDDQSSLGGKATPQHIFNVTCQILFSTVCQDFAQTAKVSRALQISHN